MVIFEIAGGLGNQMFQYAAGCSYAEKFGVEVLFDIGSYENYSLHNGFELERVFNLSVPTASTLEVNKLLPFDSRYLRKLLSFKLFQSMGSNPFIVERRDRSVIENKMQGKYLRGYWQSVDYFSVGDEFINSLFRFRRELPSRLFELSTQIEGQESIAVHVRRGDYVLSKKNMKHHGVCSLDYYKEAFARMQSTYANPVFFVFSDDLNWAFDNFDGLADVVFVDGNSGCDSFLDLQLMSMAKSNIIANSTFSWWAAWLNSNPNKKVIAPKAWYAAKNINAKIVPSGWLEV